MPLHFAMLGSGSQGNSALVRADAPGLMIDPGLGPRVAAQRLAGIGSSWDHVAGVLLTHTHADHVNDVGLRWLSGRRIPLYCHESHGESLRRHAGFRQLDRLGLVRPYDARPFLAPGGCRVEPIALSHDSGPTFGFRIEARPSRRERAVSLGYLADTGCWTEPMAEALADVDLLALEFNHDEGLQRASDRPASLIARVLGDRGHLSNEQGGALLEAVLGRSRPGRLRHVVLLHLSQDCNRPELAVAAARRVLSRAGRRASVHAAQQHEASACLAVRPATSRRPAASRPVAAAHSPALALPWEAA